MQGATYLLAMLSVLERTEESFATRAALFVHMQCMSFGMIGQSVIFLSMFDDLAYAAATRRNRRVRGSALGPRRMLPPALS